MPRRKPRREFALINMNREFAKVRGGFVTCEVSSGRPLELPAQFSSWRLGFAWHEIYETVVDPGHSGPPRYELRESQTARVTKVVAPSQ
jgi:hypothetical protein